MNAATVFVVDDAASVRESLSLMLHTAGYEVECHANAEMFLERYSADRAGCLILDLRMPGMSGAELQDELRRRGSCLPIIFLSAYGDVRSTARAIRAGAQDFLTKPVDGMVLLDRVRAALGLDRRLRLQLEARLQLEGRLARLTAREREILALALAGSTSTEIAQRLQISQRTVETHRGHILLKLNVRSLLELTQSAAAAGFAITEIGAAPHPR